MEPNTSGTENKKRILVLEDERTLAKAVRDALTTRGFEVALVNNITDGLNQMKNLGRVDAIWLDHYLLGSGNGVDFVVELKGNKKWQNIPIFVVSNTASTTNIRSYIQLGVHNYYTKADYDINQIISDVEYALTHPAT
jgi:DNA-binding response OmpR family regulator